MPKEPVRRGLKVYVRAESWTGYMYFCDLEMYTCWSTDTEEGRVEHSFGEKVVLDLSRSIEESYQ